MQCTQLFKIDLLRISENMAPQDSYIVLLYKARQLFPAHNINWIETKNSTEFYSAVSSTQRSHNGRWNQYIFLKFLTRTKNVAISEIKIFYFRFNEEKIVTNIIFTVLAQIQILLKLSRCFIFDFNKNEYNLNPKKILTVKVKF